MPQPLPEQVTNTRLTMISGDAFFQHLNDWSRILPDRPWMAADFGEIFGRLRGAGGDSRYAFPWRDSQRSAFWKEYSESTPLSQISAETALRLLVPLRMTQAPSPIVQVEDGRERVFFDAYVYPHAIVTALTVQLIPRVPLTLGAWRDRLRTLRLGSRYSVTLPGASLQSGLRAEGVLTTLNGWYRNTYFGTIDRFVSSSEPFSIVAVIQGDGIDPVVSLAARPDLQQLLNAVTAWPVNWRATQPPTLADSCLPVSSANSSPGDALYAAKRGRTLWRPALFTYRAPAGARLHTLSCLAHNQIAGIVQAESLRLFALVDGTSSEEQRSRIPARLRQSVAVQIDRLWRGDRTYRSSSIQQLLCDRSSLAQVNAVLAEMGLDTIPGNP